MMNVIASGQLNTPMWSGSDARFRKKKCLHLPNCRYRARWIESCQLSIVQVSACILNKHMYTWVCEINVRANWRPRSANRSYFWGGTWLFVFLKNGHDTFAVGVKFTLRNFFVPTRAKCTRNFSSPIRINIIVRGCCARMWAEESAARSVYSYFQLVFTGIYLTQHFRDGGGYEPSLSIH